MTSLAVIGQQLAQVLLENLDEVPAPEDVRPGWIALGSFLLLAAVTVLLWLSMRKQLGRIRFDDSDAAAPGDAPSERPVEPPGGDATDEHAETGDQDGSRPPA